VRHWPRRRDVHSVLMHRVIRIRLRTRRACGGAAGGASGTL